MIKVRKNKWLHKKNKLKNKQKFQLKIINQ